MGRATRSRGILAAVLVLLACVAGLGLWAWSTAQTAVREGRETARHVQDVQRALSDFDVAAARAAADRAADHSTRADNAIRSPALTAVGWLPGLGDDVRLARQLSSAVRAATHDAIPPLVDVAVSLTSEDLTREPGRIDVQLLVDTQEPAARAAAAAALAADATRDLDLSGVSSSWRGNAQRVIDGLDRLDRAASTTHRTLEVLPVALGAQGPREYLLAFQNLAEARPTGGIVGAWALVRLDDGEVILEEVGANDDLEALSAPVRDLGPDARELYGDSLTPSQNVNLSPHFPQAALLLSDLWQAQGRPAPSGVVSVDPVALSRLLSVTGPVSVPGGPEATADSVVHLVQARVYRLFDGENKARQAYLASLTTSVFEALLKTDLADQELRHALGSAASTGHIQVWMAEPSHQVMVADAGWAGELPDADSPGASDRVRVHLTNLDASKLDHYLGMTMTGACTGGSPVVGVDLTSSPQDDLPSYARNHLPGADPRTHRLLVSLFLPPGRGLDLLLVDGTGVPVSTGVERGWTVVQRPVDVPARETVSLNWVLSGSSTVPEVLTQPLTRLPVTDTPLGPAGRRTPPPASCDA